MDLAVCKHIKSNYTNFVPVISSVKDIANAVWRYNLLPFCGFCKSCTGSMNVLCLGEHENSHMCLIRFFTHDVQRFRIPSANRRLTSIDCNCAVSQQTRKSSVTVIASPWEHLKKITKYEDLRVQIVVKKSILFSLLGSSFFLVSLCLKANAEIVPKTPSCYCMLLM